MSKGKQNAVENDAEPSSSASRLRRTGDVGFFDDFKTLSKQRKNMSRLRAEHNRYNKGLGQRGPDFLDLISLVCDIYQSYGVERLIPMEQFHRAWELDEDAGHSCIVTSRSISAPRPSSTNRGETEMTEDKVIVKRTRKGIFGPEGSAFRILVNELRIRSHPPLRNHPNIVNLKGIAWDFEDEDETKPTPLLVEELAPHRALETFWGVEDLVQMPLINKTNLCRDIAEGIAALHACGIAHGDIKPGNILIFPATVQRGPFTAKLTDFGHSVFEFDDDPTLPIWTPLWSAPEADPDTTGLEQIKSFQDTTATDVYSYGLVAISIILGKSILSGDFSELPAGSIAAAKADDTMMERVLKVVVREDRRQKDSDFDLGVIDALLGYCIRRDRSTRSISGCLDVLRGNEEMISTQKSEYFSWEPQFVPRKIQPPPTTQPPLVCYRTLRNTSHLVKSKLVAELVKSAVDRSDRRQATCAWELSICYFSGFGVEKNWAQSRRWLTKAANLGLSSAQAFYCRLHSAMEADPVDTLKDLNSCSTEDAIALISEWMSHAVSIGCIDVLQDLRRFDQQNGCSTVVDAIAGLRKTLGSDTSSKRTSFLTAAVSGDVASLSSAVRLNPKCMDEVDEDGNNAVILAAKFGNYGALKFLLGQPTVKASHYNKDQQSVLHYMATFDDGGVLKLMPLLGEKGVDLAQEGLVVDYSPKSPTFSVPIRCNPLLNAVIQRNTLLLDALLTASHAKESRFPCVVCEAGSRFRKILAVATALHSYEAIELLQSHLEDHEKGQWEAVDGVKVWYHNELVALWRIPFHGIVVRGLEMPEPFLRAIYHGKDHLTALQRTLDNLLDKSADRRKTLYDMITTSVTHDMVDALNYLLHVHDGFSNQQLWAYALEHGPYDNPLFLSVRCGFRAVFERLAAGETSPNGAANLGEIPTGIACSRRCCKRRKPRCHVLNMAHLCLSAAVTAAHRDQFFVEYILQACPEALILAEPTESDEEITGQPSAFMAQAIFTFATRSAHLMPEKLPGVLDQLVPYLPPQKRLSESKSYIDASNSSILVSNDLICPVDPMPLSSYVLFIGSHDNCRLLQTLRIAVGHRAQQPSSAAAATHPTTAPSRNNDVELGQLVLDPLPSAALVGPRDSDNTYSDWKDYPLSVEELHWLLMGLIAGGARSDRLPLWGYVQRQLDRQYRLSARSIDMLYYLKLAVRYGNHVAVEHIQRIWQPNVKSQSWATRRIHISEAIFSTVDLAVAMRAHVVNPFPMKWELTFYGKARILVFDKTETPQMDEILASLKTRCFKPSWAMRIFLLSPASFISAIPALLSLVVFPVSIWQLAEHRARRDNKYIDRTTVGLLFLLSFLWMLYFIMVISSMTWLSLSFSPFGGIRPRTFPSAVIMCAYLGAGIPSLIIVAALLSFPIGMCSEQGSRLLFSDPGSVSDQIVMMNLGFGAIPMMVVGFGVIVGVIGGPVALFDFIMRRGIEARGRVLGSTS